jgi:predicted outer membrane repeat protein
MTSTIRGLFSAQSCGATLATALLLTAASASSAKAATITLSSTCTFAKAVTSINARSTQSGCTRSGTYGTNDTVTVPTGTFNIDTGVDITRSMTIHGSGRYNAHLQAILGISNTSDYAIQVANPNIVVKIDNLTLSGEQIVIGILVNGESDTNPNDNNLELNQVEVSYFGDSGIRNEGGRVLIQNSSISLNEGRYGGGVYNGSRLNDDGSWEIASFVAKYSSISLNGATAYGGGIYSTGKIDIRSSSLDENYAAYDGGAIFAATGTNASCSVSRDTPSAVQSSMNYNGASQGYSIISTTIPCNLHTTIGGFNSSPYCSSNVTGCPQ